MTKHGSVIAVAAALCVVLASDAFAVVTECVSVNSAGVPANGMSWNGPSSSDGRYAFFVSTADNLVEGDTNGVSDVFVFDRQTGLTERISVSSGEPGGQANGGSCEISPKDDEVFEIPAISLTNLVFSSSATDLVPDDTNGVRDVFVRDRYTHETTRASVSSSGEQANGVSYYPSVSADGTRVVFVSDATNLVPGDTNGAPDVFLRDIPSGQTYRVNLSSAPANAQATGQRVGSTGPDNDMTAWISGDGQHVAFVSSATNLMPSDTNNNYDIFVRDLEAGNPASGYTECVHVSSAGVQGNGFAWAHFNYISYYGTVVTFSSHANNLVHDDTNGKNDVFVRARPLQTTSRVSNTPAGGPADGGSSDPTCSSDGTHIAYVSEATNIASPPGDGSCDCYLGIRHAGTQRIAVDSAGNPLAGGDVLANVSATGRYVTLTNIVADLSNARAMFVDRSAVTVSTAKQQPDNASVIVSGGVASAVFPDAFYMQQDGISSPGRASGVRIAWTGDVAVGKRYIVTGVMKTNSDSERYVEATAVDPLTSEWTVDVKPLGMTNKAIGGGDWRVSGTAGQVGVDGGSGVNNMGLLIRTTGKFTYVDEHTFTIDDGSGIDIKCVVPDSVSIDPNWTHIVVTGVSSCEMSDGKLQRLIRVRTRPHDLAADWSDTQNPFGPWSLYKSPTELFATNQPDWYGDGSMQHAWADDWAGLENHVPFWMRITAVWGSNRVGDVLMHGAELDRTGSMVTSAVWTSTTTGTAVIDGCLWSPSTFYRAMTWQLRKNGTVVSEGTLISDGTYTRQSPFRLESGSGGKSALTQSIIPGDRLELLMRSDTTGGNVGDWVGVQFRVDDGTRAKAEISSL